MGLKIRHTKRGTYYYGVTGKRKVSGSSRKTKWFSLKKTKNSKSNDRYNYYSSDSEDRMIRSCCSLVVFIITIIIFIAFAKCYNSHKKPRHKRPSYNYLRQFPRHQIEVKTYNHLNWIYN